MNILVTENDNLKNSLFHYKDLIASKTLLNEQTPVSLGIRCTRLSSVQLGSGTPTAEWKWNNTEALNRTTATPAPGAHQSSSALSQAARHVTGGNLGGRSTLSVGRGPSWACPSLTTHSHPESFVLCSICEHSCSFHFILFPGLSYTHTLSLLQIWPAVTSTCSTDTRIHIIDTY